MHVNIFNIWENIDGIWQCFVMAKWLAKLVRLKMISSSKAANVSIYFLFLFKASQHFVFIQLWIVLPVKLLKKKKKMWIE